MVGLPFMDGGSVRTTVLFVGELLGFCGRGPMVVWVVPTLPGDPIGGRPLPNDPAQQRPLPGEFELPETDTAAAVCLYDHFHSRLPVGSILNWGVARRSFG